MKGRMSGGCLQLMPLCANDTAKKYIYMNGSNKIRPNFYQID